MRIAIMTASGQGNLGDELILAREIDFLRGFYKKPHFSVFGYYPDFLLLDRTNDIDFVPYFPFHILRWPLYNFQLLWKNIRAIFQSDMLLIGGGGLFFMTENNTPSWAMWHWAFRVLVAKILRKPIVYFALGVSLDLANLTRWKWLFTGKNVHVSVREFDVQKKLVSLGIPATLCPDAVFLTERPSCFKGEKRVGLALRSGMLPFEKDTITWMIESLQKRGFEPVLLSHSEHPDDPASNDTAFLEYFAHKHRLSIAKTNAETLVAYRYLDFVISMRLHSIILSVVHGVPFLALSYSKKTDELLAFLRWPHFVAAQKFDPQAFELQLDELISRESAAILDLHEQADKMKTLVTESISSLFHHVGQD